ncbi:hypothetical protein SAMN02745121_03772 [Nannocystis exedens]|uniref:Outer membrane protein beta-barrel domain-containing protein n=1 Tax=Nannocystis exedens TaxID=54 RepID=A0A1I1ZES2_9BACT|nr:hypothetical protein [Nannocystis exedens]PCC75022.1 hypothetical protein NAEX_08125 [Nannocystis exedens]SFE29828.1 hypothetical protein SAMN02745121_03772 [Nannocystis exedens]
MTPRRRSLALLPAAALLRAALESAPALAGDGVSPVGTFVDPFLVKPQGLRATGVYLHVSPALFGLDVRSPGFQTWGWGLGAGRYWTLRKRLALAFGGFFEHLLWVNPYKDSWAGATFNFVRFGPELRVGASNERVFGYGLLRVGLDLVVGTPEANLAQMFVTEVGAGLQGALGKHRRLLLGVEPAFDASVPRPWLLFRVRAIVGVRF